jgi:crotonobetainyl-CoA:carnitine CoA-transferase CaiB-like acyl-CoA transferase
MVDPVGPLDGIRVLEFSLIVAMPFNGVLLSDFGADVVKVEPLTGDPYRSAGAVVPSEGKRFQSLNRGKRSLALDLSTERGRTLLYRILPQFDVVTINYRPGVAARLGIDYETLSAIHPSLIYGNLTGFGPRGPMAGAGATDIAATAYAGLVAGDGKLGPGGEPQGLTPAIADYTTGAAMGMAICAALFHRNRTGEGQLIDGSLLQSALAIQDVYVMRQPVTDASMRDLMMQDIEQLRADRAPYADQLARRAEYRNSGASPPRLYYRSYVALDGAIVLGCLTKATRDGARHVLDIQHDTSDQPDFDSTDPEIRRQTEVWMAEIEQKVRQRPVAHWLDVFRAAGVPVAPVQFPEELSDDPQVEAMGIMVDFDHEITGPQRVVGPIVSMSKTPLAARRASPPLGYHTTELLSELGLTSSEIDDYRANNIIGGK